MHTFIVPHCKSGNASSLIVYILEGGGTPVELPVVITGLCMTQREPLQRCTGSITGVYSATFPIYLQLVQGYASNFSCNLMLPVSFQSKRGL